MKTYRLDNAKARLLMRLAYLHNDTIGMSLLMKILDIPVPFLLTHQEVYLFLIEENTRDHFHHPGYGVVRKDFPGMTICVGFDVVQINIFEEE